MVAPVRACGRSGGAGGTTASRSRRQRQLFSTQQLRHHDIAGRGSPLSSLSTTPLSFYLLFALPFFFDTDTTELKHSLYRTNAARYLLRPVLMAITARY